MNADARSIRTWVTALVVGLAVLMGVALLLAAPYSRKPVDDYIAGVKAAGKPVTVREALGPDPAPETNGAAEIESARKWMDEHKGLPETWKVVGPWSDRAGEHWFDDLTDDERRDLDAFFADAKPYFDGVASALAKPRLRTPTPSGDGRPDFGDDAMARIVPVIHVLAARALAASKTDDRLDAAEMLAALAVHWECHCVIDEFVSAMAMSDATTAIRLLVERGAVDAALLRGRFDGLLREPWLPRFREGLRLERASQLDFLRTADVGQAVVSMPAPSWEKVLLQRVSARLDALRKGESIPENSPADLARALASTERFETAATDSYPRLAAEIAAVTAAAPKASASASVVSWIERAAQTLANADAACRVARIALAVAEHHAKLGDFPASLDDLKQAFPDGVPLDPYTDAPFVYTKTPTGVRVASAGRLVDDPPLGETDLRDRRLVWELKR